MRPAPAFEALPYCGYLGLVPGSFHVWTTPQPRVVPAGPRLRVAKSRDASPSELTYTFSWRAPRHYVSNALIEAWGSTPVGEDERGDPLFEVHVSMIPGFGDPCERELICEGSDHLAVDEMIIGRPSSFAAYLRQHDTTTTD